jgi:hypothetical protein
MKQTPAANSPIGRAENIQELRFRHPVPAGHRFALHQGDVGCEAANSGEAQSQE